jgi:hypothetical protein
MFLISILVSLQMFFMTSGYFLVAPPPAGAGGSLDNYATSRELFRIPPPAEAGGLQVEGLTIIFVGIFHSLFFPKVIDFIKLQIVP